MIEIIGTELYQWDTGRSVKVTGTEASHVHFANQGDSKAVIMELANSEAKIPDYLLQTGKQLCVYAVANGVTIERKMFSVKKRERPENYVYDEDQRNFIYALITDAQEATESANQAAQNASESSTLAINSAGRASVAAEEAEKASVSANKAATLAAQTAKSLMVVGKVKGASIYLDDAIEQPLVSCKIYGKTTQDGTPTPDAPVELVSAGDDGSVSVIVSGKNLLDLSNFTDRNVAGVTIVNNRNGSITLVSDGTYDRYYNGSVLVSVPSGRYKLVEASSSRAAFVRLFPKGETTYKQYNAGVAFDYDNSTHEMRFLVQYDPGAVINATFWPMICLASETDATYEPYKGQTLTISTPNGLPGIPVTSGGNYTDANGQQWICDEIDLARGVYVQRTKKIEVNGSSAEGWYVSNIQYVEGATRFDIRMHNEPHAGGFYCLCNAYVGSVAANTGAETCWCVGDATATYLQFRICTAYASTVDELKAILQANPVAFIYQLATPIETPLSEEELAAYAALHTYKDHTTVFNDAGAHMELEYVMDARKYIDSMIAGTLHPATVE